MTDPGVPSEPSDPGVPGGGDSWVKKVVRWLRGLK